MLGGVEIYWLVHFVGMATYRVDLWPGADILFSVCQIVSDI